MCSISENLKTYQLLEVIMTYCMFYCFRCDRPSEDHRVASCRGCGTELISLVEKHDEH